MSNVGRPKEADAKEWQLPPVRVPSSVMKLIIELTEEDDNLTVSDVVRAAIVRYAKWKRSKK